jgi:uncharacterized protein YndB with AHSA1/START domain
VSGLEGDAVFSYAIGTGDISSQTFVEMIETIYVAFRRAMIQMVMNSTCGCNACANIGGLDLKFIVHHGEFLIQEIGPRRELMGSDVVLAHRLAKNTVTETTGVKAYAVFTQAVVDAMDASHLTEDWVHHREVYDAGAVECWVADMGPVWERAKDLDTIVIEPSEVKGRVSVDIDLPVERVWDRLTDPEYRRTLIGSDRQVREGKAKGRRGAGDVYQCYHGDTVVPSVIVEWLPFARLLTQDLIHVPGGTVNLLVDYTVESTDTGTLLTMTAARPEGSAVARAGFATVGPTILKAVDTALGAFRDRLESEALVDTTN